MFDLARIGGATAPVDQLDESGLDGWEEIGPLSILPHSKLNGVWDLKPFEKPSNLQCLLGRRRHDLAGH
jgi:hypothetical protein